MSWLSEELLFFSSSFVPGVELCASIYISHCIYLQWCFPWIIFGVWSFALDPAFTKESTGTEGTLFSIPLSSSKVTEEKEQPSRLRAPEFLPSFASFLGSITAIGCHPGRMEANLSVVNISVVWMKETCHRRMWVWISGLPASSSRVTTVLICLGPRSPWHVRIPVLKPGKSRQAGVVGSLALWSEPFPLPVSSRRCILYLGSTKHPSACSLYCTHFCISFSIYCLPSSLGCFFLWRWRWSLPHSAPDTGSIAVITGDCWGTSDDKL